nr:sterol desaturase family protein [Thalassotalea sp. G2M2-11]
MYLFDANKRIYWGYLLSAVMLAVPIFLLQLKQQEKQASVVGFLSFLFPKSIYLSQSARNDYFLFIVNKLLKAALFPLIILTMAPIALWVTNSMENLFGTIEHLQLSASSVMIVFTLVLFLVDDFTRFYLHYLLHRIPILWEFHKVHHSARVLTPFTIYRSHPVESYLYACRMALTQGFVVGVCYYFLGPTLKMIDIVGANMFVFAFNIMGSNLRHSHIWLSWGDKIEHWFISPAQHQIHHSDNPKLCHSNFGSALAIWDRVAGCFTLASQVKKLSFGIGEQTAEHDKLLNIYIAPFKHAWRRIKGALVLTNK